LLIILETKVRHRLQQRNFSPLLVRFGLTTGKCRQAGSGIAETQQGARSQRPCSDRFKPMQFGKALLK